MCLSLSEPTSPQILSQLKYSKIKNETPCHSRLNLFTPCCKVDVIAHLPSMFDLYTQRKYLQSQFFFFFFTARGLFPLPCLLLMHCYVSVEQVKPLAGMCVSHIGSHSKTVWLKQTGTLLIKASLCRVPGRYQVEYFLPGETLSNYV